MSRVGSLKTELDAAAERVRSSEALLESIEAERDALEQRAAELSESLDKALHEVGPIDDGKRAAPSHSRCMPPMPCVLRREMS